MLLLAMQTHREQTYGHGGGGEEGEGGMDGESNMETMCFYDRISKLTSHEGIDLPKATEPSSS